ncbi:MAG: hypothetical protein KKA97_04035 [Actinobacteria bacterium]|nr:hypothetical protein [Actinomycetota bacterium]
MPDRIFVDPRLARLYDALDPDRCDLVLATMGAEVTSTSSCASARARGRAVRC